MMASFFFKIFNFFVKKGFYSFGNSSIIKPFPNITNKQFISIGDNVNIGSFCWLGVDTEFSGIKCRSEKQVRLSIGNDTTIGNNAVITANNTVSIGKNCILSAYVFISDHSHEYTDVTKNLNEQPLSEGGQVIIGDNVFIGIKASIMKNVTIGDRVVVGANSVVTKDIPAYSVVAGSPARIIKKYDFKKGKWFETKE